MRTARTAPPGSSWSSPQAFSLAALNAPTETAPASGLTIPAATGYDMPTFSWTGVTGAGSYTLYVVDSTTSQVSQHQRGQRHLVSAHRGAGADAGTQLHLVRQRRRHQRHAPRQLLDRPHDVHPRSVQLTPSNSSTIPHTTGWLTPTFTWVAATEAVSYNVFLLDVTNPNQPALSTTTPPATSPRTHPPR